MAWNGSSGIPKTASKRKPSIRKIVWVIIGCTLLLAACVVMFYPYSVYTDQMDSGEPDARIKTVDSSLKPIKSRKISDKQPNLTCEILQPSITEENPIVDKKILGRVVKWIHRDGPPVFTNRFDALVCEIMTAEPGERFLDLDLGEDYDDAFEECLNLPIVIYSNDSNDVKYMKKVVLDAREEVRKLTMLGKKPSEILTEAREELNKIADYREQLQEAYDKYLKTATSIKDAIQFAKEANELLAEYGALPIDGPDTEEDEDLDLVYEKIVGAKQLSTKVETDEDTEE